MSKERKHSVIFGWKPIETENSDGGFLKLISRIITFFCLVRMRDTVEACTPQITLQACEE